MATPLSTPFASLSRRFPFSRLLSPLFSSSSAARFSSSSSSSSAPPRSVSGDESEPDHLPPDHGQPLASAASGPSSDVVTSQRPPPYQRPLENGLDPGIYKAILVGKVGQRPVQKQLRSGRSVVLFSLGTGGIRNNRRPLDNEEPREYAERCAVQWHRVSVYPERLGGLALNHVKPGSILYVEGNLETKVFSDPITGLVRRIREIAIRRDGRLVFLNNDSEPNESQQGELRNVGYF